MDGWISWSSRSFLVNLKLQWRFKWKQTYLKPYPPCVLVCCHCFCWMSPICHHLCLIWHHNDPQIQVINNLYSPYWFVDLFQALDSSSDLCSERGSVFFFFPSLPPNSFCDLQANDAEKLLSERSALIRLLSARPHYLPEETTIQQTDVRHNLLALKFETYSAQGGWLFQVLPKA